MERQVFMFNRDSIVLDAVGAHSMALCVSSVCALRLPTRQVPCHTVGWSQSGPCFLCHDRPTYGRALYGT